MELFTFISEQNFNAWKPSLKIIHHDHPRIFASLKLAEDIEEVAFSWRSNLIAPVVVLDGNSLVWLGVDQRAICITRQGSIMFSIGLSGLLLNIKRFPDFVAILCDMEVITVNLDYSIRGVYHLKDIPNNIELIDGNLVVEFADGGTQIEKT